MNIEPEATLEQAEEKPFEEIVVSETETVEEVNIEPEDALPQTEVDQEIPAPPETQEEIKRRPRKLFK